MVIWFNNKKARAFLLKNGTVYTLRPKPRRTGREPLFYGEFKKKGVVSVDFIREIRDDNELEEYVKYSGFSTVEAWREKAGKSRFLYKVTVLGLVK